MRTRREWVGRTLVEFAIIVVGVFVALAADRWLAGRDDETAARLYYEQLETDLVGDSVVLEGMIGMAEYSTATAISLLELAGGVTTSRDLPSESLGSLPDLTRGWVIVGSYTPFEAKRGTWENLVSTGRMGLLDEDVRVMLSNYYDGVRRLRGVEEAWVRTLDRFHLGSATVIADPLDRLALISELADSFGFPLAERLEGARYSRSKDDDVLLNELLARLRMDRDLHAALADARWVQSVVAVQCRLLQDLAVATLARVRAAGAL